MKGLIQRQARALGDPTRFEIFRYVAEASGPVRVATLTEHFSFNQSAIRQHLAKLVDARLLIEELATASGTGRPPLRGRESRCRLRDPPGAGAGHRRGDGRGAEGRRAGGLPPGPGRLPAPDDPRGLTWTSPTGRRILRRRPWP